MGISIIINCRIHYEHFFLKITNIMKQKLIYIPLLLILILALQSCDNKYSYIDDPIAYLKTAEFIEVKDGNMQYHLEKLDTINGDLLFCLVQKTNTVGTKNIAMSLKITGLSLPDSIQRKNFTTKYLDIDKHYPSDFLLIEKLNFLYKNNRYSVAITYFAKSLDSDQTYRVLEAFGFLRSKDTGYGSEGHYSIHNEKIEHLSSELLLIFIDNLHKGFTSFQEKHFAERIQDVIDDKNTLINN